MQRQNLFELEAQSVPPYTESAVIYDHMMKDVDYKRWAKYLVQLMQVGGLDTRRSKLKGKKLCELGSGTGNIAFQMSKYGFEVTGIDSSKQMVDIAQRKLSTHSSMKIDFYNQDMVSYRTGNLYDVIICVYDSINYILGNENIESLFKNAFFNLNPTGLFIFDASLEPNSMNDPTLFTQRGKYKTIYYQRESLYDPKTKIHTTRVRIKRDAKIFEETHSEYVYGLETIRRSLKSAGFKETFAAGDFTMLEVNEDSERVHFILAKQPND